ncbi:hypothetical protein HWV62_16246 [Athelia sp. TMB]|nr:hypothetical protein HWV62_16246 [Athelia sp. TMB]
MSSKGITQNEDPSSMQSGSPLDVGDGSGSSCGLAYEHEVFAETARALEQVKEVIAGSCLRLLASPIDGLLDVIRTCSFHLDANPHLAELKTPDVQTHGQDEVELNEILKALIVLDGRTDSALALWEEFIGMIQSVREETLPMQLPGDAVTLSSLLENLSADIKHLLAQHPIVETPLSRADVVSSVQDFVQNFTALNKLCIEDIVAHWDSHESKENGPPDQHVSSPSPPQSLAIGTPPAETPHEAITQPSDELAPHPPENLTHATSQGALDQPLSARLAQEEYDTSVALWSFVTTDTLAAPSSLTTLALHYSIALIVRANCWI